MPWTGKSFKKHNNGLSGQQATKAAKIANAVLSHSGDEGMAIAVANKAVKRQKTMHDPMKEGYHKMGDE